jgi:hypothetical protein
LFRIAKIRPDDPRCPFSNQEEAWQRLALWIDWYIQRHRHSTIKFVTPHHRQNGQDAEIRRQPNVVDNKALQRQPGRWSHSNR